MHHVLTFPCCLLHSSVLPQHLHAPHSLASQNLIPTILYTHRSLLKDPIYINNKLSPIHQMSRIWSVLRSMETWNTSWTPDKLGGKANRYATIPTLSSISKGLIYLGDSFPRLSNMTTPLLVQEDMIAHLKL